MSFLYNLVMKFRVFFLFCILALFVPAFAEEPIYGVWENGGRFVEFSQPDESGNLNMKIVLKPYYTYVYEPLGNFTTRITTVENFTGLNILQITYPRMKQSVYMPVCLIDDFLFTSFFQRQDYTSSKETLPEEMRPYGITDEQARSSMFENASPLYGFWTEQGTQDGIMLYANEPPKYFDAYFFTDGEYFKFRYWLDDLENTQKQAKFSDSEGTSFTIPRVLTRGAVNYSCITANATTLRNYENGIYELKYTDNSYYITLTPMKAGPGKVASKDTYENVKYPEVINLPLYLTEDGKIFSFGEPFLFKTKITDLNAEIIKHNALKKEPLEPQLVPDEIEFYKERIKELEKRVLKDSESTGN